MKEAVVLMIVCPVAGIVVGSIISILKPKIEVMLSKNKK